MITRKWTKHKAKILAVNSPYESFNGLRQEIELDLGTVTVPLFDKYCQVTEQEIGKSQVWKLRNKTGIIEGYTITQAQADWENGKQIPTREKDIFRAKQRNKTGTIMERDRKCQT